CHVVLDFCRYLLMYRVGSRYGFFFFFQAEDGIRDSSVTGVQTCALPILLVHWIGEPAGTRTPVYAVPVCQLLLRHCSVARIYSRSEERRVGKECRSRGVP